MMFNFGNFGGGGGGASIPPGKKIAVITGTTSGLGLETARALINRGDYHVICGNRNVDKMQSIAEEEGFDKKSFTVLPLDLGSFASTRAFAKKVQSIKARPLDALVCNAAVYQPASKEVRNSTWLDSAIHDDNSHTLSQDHQQTNISLFFFDYNSTLFAASMDRRRH